MLLKKFDENKEALKRTGREAIAESRRLGLPISARDLQNEAEDLVAFEQKKRISAPEGLNLCPNLPASSSAVPTDRASRRHIQSCSSTAIVEHL